MRDISPSVSPDDLLLDAASRCPPSRGAVAHLASNLPTVASDHLVRRALDERGPEAATALGFALALRGGKLDDDTLVPLLRETEWLNVIPLLFHLSSDIARTTVGLLERGKLPHDRQCLAVCAAARALKLSHAPVPDVLVARTKILLRSSPINCGAYLRLAADSLGDAELVAMAPRVPARLVKRTVEALDRVCHDLGEFLPEYAEPPVLRGFTVRHASAKVGRNDPCPCGSGAKHKKCCGTSGKVAEANPVGLTAEHFAPGNAALISESQFRLMRPHELAQLDPSELPVSRLIVGIRALSRFQRWQLAEQWTDVLTSREDTDIAWWEDLGNDALAAGEVELARRCLARLGEDEPEYLSLKIATHDGSPLLDQWEAVLREDPDADFAEHRYTLAFALLDKYPALGILVARGCLSAKRAFDSEVLLEEVSDARDRLGLDPDEPYWDVFETLLELDEARTADKRLSAAEQARMQALEAKVQQSRAEVAALKQELLTQRQLLRNAEARPPELAPVQPSHASDTTDHEKLAAAERERERLRSKVRELKSRLKQEVGERHLLRDSLKQLRAEDGKPSNGFTRPEETRPGSKRPQLVEADPDGIAIEEPLTPEGVVPLRRPTVSERQLEELKALEGDLGRKALACLADLCGGAPNAWHQVKRLKKSRDTLSIRLGIHHRLLFTCTACEVRLEAVVARRDLERYVDGLARR